jgi:hypothetical protein
MTFHNPHITSVLAIDPGASGGLSWVTGNTATETRPMPSTYMELVDFLRNIRMFIRICFVEEISGFIPAGGAGQMFHFGRNVGYLLGVLDTLDFKVVTVRPQVWQKALGLGNVGTVRCKGTMSASEKKSIKASNSKLKREWKGKLCDFARRRYPELGKKVTLKTCDSLLILEYVKQINER